MNLSKHRQAIVIFSVAIPFVIFAIVFGAGLHYRGKLQAIYEEKEKNLETYEIAKVEVRKLEAELAEGGRKEKIEYWNSKLDQDFVPTLSSNISKILGRYDENVLKQNSMSQLSSESAIAKSSKDAYNLVSLSFEGGFKPMQLLMAELEREMPQLVLEKLTITPVVDDKEGTEGTGKLMFDLVYLSWKKETPETPES